MYNIKIVIDEQFKGINSGWPLRYIGLIDQLYGKYQLSIFAPGDTLLLKNKYPAAEVCRSSSPNALPKKVHFFKFLKYQLFPNRFDILLPGFNYFPDFRNVLTTEKRQYDISILFGLSSLIFYADANRSKILICDFGDSRLRALKSKKIKKSSIKDQIIYCLDEHYIKKIKNKFVPSFTNILAITQEDKKFISSVLKTHHVHTLPNGVDLLERDINDSIIRKKFESDYILFLGTLNFEPNVESIQYSLLNLWPILKEKYPRLKFKIVGRFPSETIIEAVKTTEGVELHPNVKDVYPFYLEAKLFLGPIFSGAGMKNKFLESLNAGTPVVTTSEGAIGIDIVTYHHGVVADNKQKLLNGTISILDSQFDEYASYITKSHKLAQRYTWAHSGNLLSDIINQLYEIR